MRRSAKMPARSRRAPLLSTQLWCQRWSVRSYMFRLLPLKPRLPVQFSSRAQPAAIDSILLSPAFVPLGRNTSHSPSQKSNWRCSAAWHAGGGAGGGTDGACATAVPEGQDERRGDGGEGLRRKTHGIARWRIREA